MANTKTAQPAESLSYEQARDELLDVVARLESGGASLAESMELFKRGESLASLCEGYLDQARSTLAASQVEETAMS